MILHLLGWSQREWEDADADLTREIVRVALAERRAAAQAASGQPH